ncbi:hypothetical protein ACN38_g6357 [Penicillium nordicum]|uniref:Uncharacterized protein n=1 Tax=Penicillium nordicum TaxID=229535 RepID=A0A0M9WFE8_9EURO|nr:hypothetical protein ACN38_g6357 [Penicillium nordicum]
MYKLPQVINDLASKKKKKETSPGRLELPTSRLTVGRANQLRHGDLIVGNFSGGGFISGFGNNGSVLVTTESMNWIYQHSAVSIMVNSYGSGIIDKPTESNNCIVVKMTLGRVKPWNSMRLLIGGAFSPYFVVIGQSFKV